MKQIVSRFVLLVVLIATGSGYAPAQLSWTKDLANPVLSGSETASWETHVDYPFVLFNPDSGRYEMWYGGSSGAPWIPYRIGFAWSVDGIDWTRYPGNPVLSPDPGTWDQSSVEAPTVIREGGQYKMWYMGRSGGSRGIGYATSPDGIQWTKHTGNPVFAGGTAAWEVYAVWCSVLKEAVGYNMWYTGVNATRDTTRIGRATSTDGLNWNRDTVNNPVINHGSSGAWDDGSVLSPYIVTIEGRQCLIYTGRHDYDNPPWQLGAAWSTDGGTTWTKDISNPVLSPGPVGSWDASYMQSGNVLLRDGTLHMWYSASSLSTSGYRWRIGHATAPAFVEAADRQHGVPVSFTLGQNYPNPFNPSTTIRYGLPSRSNVTLTVFNTLGQQVATLVQGEQEAGYHEVQFDGSGLASGVYVYRLQAGDFVQSLKLTLLR